MSSAVAGGNLGGQGDTPLEALALHGLVVHGSSGTSETGQQAAAKEKPKVWSWSYTVKHICIDVSKFTNTLEVCSWSFTVQHIYIDISWWVHENQCILYCVHFHVTCYVYLHV